MCAESAQEKRRRRESDELYEARNCIGEAEELRLGSPADPDRDRLVQLAQARALVSIAASLERLCALEVAKNTPHVHAWSKLIRTGDCESWVCLGCGASKSEPIK